MLGPRLSAPVIRKSARRIALGVDPDCHAFTFSGSDRSTTSVPPDAIDRIALRRIGAVQRVMQRGAQPLP